jgi:hypothetical protein
MPPEGYSTITVPDEVFERVTEVMIEYDCDSIADAVDIASAVALERDGRNRSKRVGQWALTN